MRGQTRTAARRPAARARTRARSSSSSPSPSASDSESVSLARPAKRRKTASSSSTSKLDAYRALLLLLHQQKPTADLTAPSLPPTRCHTLAYHVPLLLLVDGGPRAAFLSWFDSVSSARAMPWRKPWIDPSSFASPSELRSALEKRAYEVWISEIMLQQTRVAVVVDYWKRWMSKWPTIHDLAAADTDDVLAAWRGLGYYSRATRIHTAAQLAVADPSMQGLLPSSAADLAEKIPGVGRYTAGAISCIAFGRPAPMVDGNVLRVLSRQLGLYGNIKTDKAVIDLIWAAAEALVNAVALDGEDGDEERAAADTRSDRPGRWGQALMELGSTVCAPRPDCGACPITSTCRAYSEGLALLSKEKSQVSENGIADMEDLCGVCQPFDDTDDVENQPPPPPAATKGGKQATLSAFFAKAAVPAKPSAKPKVDIEGIVRHARRFPIKVVKKAVREEETLVCAVVRADGRYLIRKRPAKGLLAGLWEFPSSLLENPKGSKAAERKKLAREFVEGVLNKDEVEYVGELGSVPWLFSHIRLTMHVHLFKIKGTEDAGVEGTTEARWSDSVDTESMGTGMRKCWELVKEAT